MHLKNNCKSGLRRSRRINVDYELGERIRYQISLEARIISLNLSGTEYETLDEYILGLHLENILILYGCKNIKDVSNLGYVKELYLINCPKVKDVSSLGKVYKLSIGGNEWNFTLLKGLEALSNVHELYLEYCIIPALSPLANVHKLTLSFIDDISDVSVLSSVHTLTLTYLDVTDVSDLDTVHKLTLENCNYVEDVSSLSTVHKLTIHDS